MEIKLVRYNSQNDYTDGLLFIDGDFVCFTIEDEIRTKKVWGETRIPNGYYELKLRSYGGFHNRYSEKFDFHKGMIQIMDIPNFKDVLIHIGNTDDDTAGCVLVGMNQDADNKGLLGRSTVAYKKIYPIIANHLANKKEVRLLIETIG